MNIIVQRILKDEDQYRFAITTKEKNKYWSYWGRSTQSWKTFLMDHDVKEIIKRG